MTPSEQQEAVGAASDDSCHPVVIDYTNWRGCREDRRVVPQRLYFGSTEHHSKPQWLMEAHDLDRGEMRTYAMASVHAWREAAQPPITDADGEVPDMADNDEFWAKAKLSDGSRDAALDELARLNQELGLYDDEADNG